MCIYKKKFISCQGLVCWLVSCSGTNCPVLSSLKVPPARHVFIPLKYLSDSHLKSSYHITFDTDTFKKWIYNMIIWELPKNCLATQAGEIDDPHVNSSLQLMCQATVLLTPPSPLLNVQSLGWELRLGEEGGRRILAY